MNYKVESIYFYIRFSLASHSLRSSTAFAVPLLRSFGFACVDWC